MYFAVGEPIQHLIAPPTAAVNTPFGARETMLVSFFHWGMHAWAIYGVVGLALALSLITIFFVTSADSGAMVIDHIASRGNPHFGR
jgi:choline-glycine betaine transporter